MCAITSGNIEAVRLLIASPGIDVSQIHGRVFDYITGVGAVYRLKDRAVPQQQFGAWTALHCEVSCSHDEPGDIELIRMLLNAGADVRVQTDEGETPLDIAKRNELHTMITELTKWEQVSP